MAQIIAALKSRDGRILIPGIYDRVRDPAKAEVDAWKRLPFHAEQFRRNEVGSAALAGEPGYDVLTRIWARPTLEVHGIKGGYIGEGAKTVIPASASAKISVRLVPDQDPGEVAAQVSRAVAAACPAGVYARFELMHAAPPCLIDPSSLFITKAAEAMEQVFGTPTAYIRCGGSIPIVGLIEQKLRIPSVLAGFGLPDDQIHAPNEKLSLANYRRGIASMMRYYELLGG